MFKRTTIVFSVLALVLSAQAMAKSKKTNNEDLNIDSQQVSAVEKSEVKVEGRAVENMQTRTGLGFYIGPSISTISASSDGLDEGKYGSKVAATFGARASIPLLQYLAIQPELGFNQKGTKYSHSEEYVDHLQLYYAEASALLRLQMPTSSITPYLLVGPTFSYLLGKAAAIDYEGQSYEVSLDGDQLNNFDISATAGAGFGFDLSDTTGMFFEGRYQLGLTNIVNTSSSNVSSDSISMKNRSIQILTGLVFAI